jgi:hypothetical protein
MRAKPVPTGAGPPPPTLYVQIPAYRDTELGATLADLYRKAERPEALRVGVLWQRAEDESLPRAVRRLPNLELIEIPFHRSRGCNWARNLLQDRWRGERYTMFLDSHHRFARGWDRMLIEMHGQLRAAGVERPLLTAYLPPYDPLNHPRNRRCRPYKIFPIRREDGLLIHLTSHAIPHWRRLTAPVRAEFLSAHLIFADGRFNADLRWDPQIYFAGDEVAMSLRAHTSGYDLYHPHRVIGWHAYDRASRTPHWDDHGEWAEQHRRSLRRLRRLFTGRIAGPLGLGSERSPSSFEDRLLVPLVEPAR